ncbi:MAG: caspase family protein [Myxococcaceae bacterium]|nr:caspase family protein [Myxococcaceae bacterium]
MTKTVPVALAVVLLVAGTASADVRRFAVVVGNNHGAAKRAVLRYAEADADKVARALREVGGVKPSDLFVLKAGSADQLERTLERARRAIRQAELLPSTKTLLLFYFSGHGDGEALELGKDRVTYGHLRALLSGTGAIARVAIIDACQSGSAILQKGGVPAEPFTLQVADRLAVSGEVFITSTAANEAALESSELRGSVFTSHLVSGLRGAADASGDHEVTLSELYRYAYDRTVATTALTPSGAQHPTWRFDIAGQGEIVLASLRHVPSRLEVPKDADRVVITDVRQDEVVAEVTPGAARSIALLPGRYAVRSVRHGRSDVTSVLLTGGSRRAVSWEDFGEEPVGADARPQAPPGRKDGALRVCVLGFRNLTGDPKLDSLGEAIAEAIHTDFGTVKGVRLVERGQLDLDLGELEFEAGRYVDPKTRAQLGRIRGAEVVVLGSYQRAGATTRVTGRFVHVETGEVLFTLKVEQPNGRLLALQDAVAAAVTAKLPQLEARLRKP